MARTAPRGPITKDQKRRDRKVKVSERFTESLTNLGWITDWITKLITL